MGKVLNFIPSPQTHQAMKFEGHMLRDEFWNQHSTWKFFVNQNKHWVKSNLISFANFRMHVKECSDSVPYLAEDAYQFDDLDLTFSTRQCRVCCRRTLVNDDWSVQPQQSRLTEYFSFKLVTSERLCLVFCYNKCNNRHSHGA